MPKTKNSRQNKAQKSSVKKVILFTSTILLTLIIGVFAFSLIRGLADKSKFNAAKTRCDTDPIVVVHFKSDWDDSYLVYKPSDTSNYDRNKTINSDTDLFHLGTKKVAYYACNDAEVLAGAKDIVMRLQLEDELRIQNAIGNN